MRAFAPVVAVVILLSWQATALGCGTWCAMLSAGETAPAPAAPRPTTNPRSADALAADLGLHRVTQVWAGDVVRTVGAVTTYSTNTARQHPGTYATRVASVATGQSSRYDSQVANGRTTLTDGRLVQGDVYASYVWTGSAIVFDRYVFFQDDRETARRATPRPTPVPTAAPRPRTGAVVAPVATPRPATPAPARTSAPRATPRAAPAPPTPPPTPRPTLPPPRVVSVGVAAAPQGDVLTRIEVLRGRRIPLWLRATVDGAPGRVLSWRLVSGDLVALGPVSGNGDDPLVAAWHSVSRPGSAFSVRIGVTVEVPGEAPRSAEATIDVVVRSPALIE